MIMMERLRQFLESPREKAKKEQGDQERRRRRFDNLWTSLENKSITDEQLVREYRACLTDYGNDPRYKSFFDDFLNEMTRQRPDTSSIFNSQEKET